MTPEAPQPYVSKSNVSKASERCVVQNEGVVSVYLVGGLETKIKNLTRTRFERITFRYFHINELESDALPLRQQANASYLV